MAINRTNAVVLINAARRGDLNALGEILDDILDSLDDLSETELDFVDGVTAGTGLASKAVVLDASGNFIMPDNGVFGFSRAAVAAAGTTAADATALTDQVNLVTASDNAKGVALPAAATTVGPIWVINTVANASLLVYPVNGGNDNINGLAEDAAFTLGPGQAAMFTPTSGTQWYVSDASGVKAKVLTGTYTVTAAENGTTYYLNSATEFATTLPAPFLGAKYSFIVSAAPSGASYTIVSGSSSNIIKGHVLSSDLNAASDGDFETSGGDTITLVDSKAVAGDRIDLESDGTNWFMSGACSVFDAITITTAS